MSHIHQSFISDNHQPGAPQKIDMFNSTPANETTRMFYWISANTCLGAVLHTGKAKRGGRGSPVARCLPAGPVIMCSNLDRFGHFFPICNLGSQVDPGLNWVPGNVPRSMGCRLVTATNESRVSYLHNLHILHRT